MVQTGKYSLLYLKKSVDGLSQKENDKYFCIHIQLFTKKESVSNNEYRIKRENVGKAKELKTKALKTQRTGSVWANSTILLPGKSMICMNFLLDKKTNCLPSAWNLGAARRWGNYCANYACLSLSAFSLLLSHFCLIYSLHLYLNLVKLCRFVYANIICSLYLYNIIWICSSKPACYSVIFWDWLVLSTHLMHWWTVRFSVWMLVHYPSKWKYIN